jgi:hypothetical protein
MVATPTEEPVLYTILLEEFPQNQSTKYEPRFLDERRFFNREEAFNFLSDCELFNWQVKGWDINDNWNEVTQFHIHLCRFNCD